MQRHLWAKIDKSNAFYDRLTHHLFENSPRLPQRIVTCESSKARSRVRCGGSVCPLCLTSLSAWVCFFLSLSSHATWVPAFGCVFVVCCCVSTLCELAHKLASLYKIHICAATNCCAPSVCTSFCFHPNLSRIFFKSSTSASGVVKIEKKSFCWEEIIQQAPRVSWCYSFESSSSKKEIMICSN